MMKLFTSLAVVALTAGATATLHDELLRVVQAPVPADAVTKAEAAVTAAESALKAATGDKKAETAAVQKAKTAVRSVKYLKQASDNLDGQKADKWATEEKKFAKFIENVAGGSVKEAEAVKAVTAQNKKNADALKKAFEQLPEGKEEETVTESLKELKKLMEASVALLADDKKVDSDPSSAVKNAYTQLMAQYIRMNAAINVLGAEFPNSAVAAGTTSTKKDKGGLAGWAIALIVVSVVLVCGVGLFFVLRK